MIASVLVYFIFRLYQVKSSQQCNQRQHVIPEANKNILRIFWRVELRQKQSKGSVKGPDGRIHQQPKQRD